jgi:hypothetical protein
VDGVFHHLRCSDRVWDFLLTGGGTQVMKGWQLIKNLHFNLHGGNGKAWYDEI